MTDVWAPLPHAARARFARAIEEERLGRAGTKFASRQSMHTHTLVEYELVLSDLGGTRHVPRVCGRARADGIWEGWLEFDAVGGTEVRRTAVETTQPTHGSLVHWAGTLSAVYLEGALARARYFDDGLPLEVASPEATRAAAQLAAEAAADVAEEAAEAAALATSPSRARAARVKAEVAADQAERAAAIARSAR